MGARFDKPSGKVQLVLRGDEVRVSVGSELGWELLTRDLGTIREYEIRLTPYPRMTSFGVKLNTVVCRKWRRYASHERRDSFRKVTHGKLSQFSVTLCKIINFSM